MTPSPTPISATLSTLGSPNASATLPAIYGATPPPKISPAPTTIPIAAEMSPGGADSVAIGPVIKATFPRQKKEQTNNATNNGATAGPVFANHQTAIVAPMNQNGERLATESVGQSRPTELAEEAAESEGRRDDTHLSRRELQHVE